MTNHPTKYESYHSNDLKGVAFTIRNRMDGRMDEWMNKQMDKSILSVCGA